MTQLLHSQASVPSVGTPETAAANVVAFFEALTPASLDSLGTVYTANAYFKDPFNDVRGLIAIHGIFNHMFVALDKPRFIVTESITSGDQSGQCFLTWDFEFYFKGQRKLQTVRGASHLKFTDDGLIDFHRDYWDAAEELYEKLPVVGPLMRWSKRRVSS